MNLLCGIIIAHLLCYNVELRAKEPKRGYGLFGGQNKLESAWGGEVTMEEGLPPKDDTEEGETSQTFDETTALEGDDGHPNLRSTFSFFQGKGQEEVKQNAQQRHEGNTQRGDAPSDHKGEMKHADTSTQIATEKIIKEGENLYINGGITNYEYNNDDEFFKAFHMDNANKQIEINSPCFNLKNENACAENRDCFYDHSYQTCFQNCKNLGERECSRYTECKLTMNGCENEGYLNINVFGSDIGSDVRACELFNSEGSCYMMEEVYKNFGNKKKTNFNCVWLSYKHEYRKHKEGDSGKSHKKEPREERGVELGGVINVNSKNGQKSESDGHPNYHVLRTDGSRSIGRDEEFLSLLELKSSEKKKKNQKNSSDGKEPKKENAKKGKAHGDDEDYDEDDDDNGEGLDAEEDPDFNDVNDEEGAEKEEDLGGEEVDENEGDDFDEEMEKKMGKSKGKEESSDKIERSGDGEGSDTKLMEGREPSDGAPTGESIPKGDELLIPPEKLVETPTEVVTESIIDDAGKADQNDKHGQGGQHGQDGQDGQDGQHGQCGQLGQDGQDGQCDQLGKDGHADAENDEFPGDHPTGNGKLGSLPHERDILKHNFNSSSHGDHYDEWISVETSICANLNERPNPSALLEGVLIAENEAELRSIKNKYKVTDNEICVKPSNEPNISFSPKKNFYMLGEKIEFTCQNGYKLVGTTNVGVCVGRNKIVPNISCESLNNFDDVQENIQKLNGMVSSGVNSALSGFLAIVLFVVGAVLSR